MYFAESTLEYAHALEFRHHTKHPLGMLLVVAAHILLIYALFQGLAHYVITVANKPIETRIVEEIKEKPVELPPPPPHLQEPPPPYIPPPEISIQLPPNPAPTISIATNVKPVTAPPRGPVVAPPAPPPPPPPPPKLAVRRNPVPIYKVSPAYPRLAVLDGIEGMVEARLGVNSKGDVTSVKIIKSVPERVFDHSAIAALSQYKFQGDGTNWIGVIDVRYNLSS